MQKNNLLAALTLSAISVLAACNSEPEVVTINKYDPQAAALANAAPVAPPPMITESHAYRCRDNSLVYIDFMNNNSAVVRNQRATRGRSRPRTASTVP